MPTELQERTAHLDAWVSGPLGRTRTRLTPAQRAAHDDPAPIVVLEGGNQSGKTLTACVDLLWRQPPAAWYCTTTYELFSQQAWAHFCRLLRL